MARSDEHGRGQAKGKARHGHGNGKKVPTQPKVAQEPGLMNTVRETAQTVPDSVSNRAEKAQQTLASGARQLASSTSEAMENAGTTVTEFMSKHPAAVFAAAVAFGFLLSRALDSRPVSYLIVRDKSLPDVGL